MADAMEKGHFSQTMPAPPPFWKAFTQANLDRLREIQSSSETVPPELQVLIPPPPPEDGKYRSFGGSFDVRSIPHEHSGSNASQMNQSLPSLKDMGQEQLFPDFAPGSSPPDATGEEDENGADWSLERAFYLKKTIRSMLLNFLELIAILSRDPSQAQNKIQDMTVLFLNAHHMINEYRPHQARETLILMMEEQVEKKLAEIKRIKDLSEKMEALLETLPVPTIDKGDLPATETPAVESTPDKLTLNSWAECDRQLG
jgi:mediator of RNA polymerase II transcription subunit 7